MPVELELAGHCVAAAAPAAQKDPIGHTTGELDSAAATGSVQFGVQIFKKVIEIRNGNKIPRLTMRYYNNRINDRQLNSSIFTWFDRTSNSPVILRENYLWNASVSFESAVKNELTTAFNKKVNFNNDNHD